MIKTELARLRNMTLGKMNAVGPHRFGQCDVLADQKRQAALSGDVGEADSLISGLSAPEAAINNSASRRKMLGDFVSVWRSIRVREEPQRRKLQAALPFRRPAPQVDGRAP